MYGSRYLIFAVVFAAVIAVSGCKRDFKAPEPKAENAGITSPADSGRMLPYPADHSA